ncbi:MAG: hypothetical protein WA183_13960 [Chthoniobacterales bacterium]
MTKKTFVLILITICISIAANVSLFGATIPAGTTLVVRTVVRISSHDRVGRTFNAQLDQDVTVKSSALLKAGTKVSGKIEASRANSRKSAPLTLSLTQVSNNGRMISIKTDSFQPESKSTTARQAQMRGGFSVGSSTVAPGTKMEFRLAQPVNL